MNGRRLSLYRETLTELSTDDLTQVVGAQATLLFGGLTGYYPSIFDPCTITTG